MLGLYCERAFRPGLWAEPLNTVSNLAFFIAALLCLRAWLAGGKRDVPGLLLIVVLAAIGIGSTAFHAWPNRVTVLMDVIPIGLFILGAFGLALVRCLGAAWWVASIGAALFAVASFLAASRLSPLLPPGMAGYLPPLVALPLVAAATWWRSSQSAASERLLHAAGALLVASLLFALSLSLRTIDRPVCSLLPTGTHFLWHIINAMVLWRVLTALLALGQPKQTRT